MDAEHDKILVRSFYHRKRVLIGGYLSQSWWFWFYRVGEIEKLATPRVH
jgi:hypothetical protein